MIIIIEQKSWYETPPHLLIILPDGQSFNTEHPDPDGDLAVNVPLVGFSHNLDQKDLSICNQRAFKRRIRFELIF